MMKDSIPVFTRQRGGLDTRVWVTLALLLLLTIGLCGFMMTRCQICGPYLIEPRGYSAGKANTYYVNREVVFALNAGAGDLVSWDFGDGSSPAQGSTVRHAYSREGAFQVRATVNGQCTELLAVSALQMPDTTPAGQPVITRENPIEGPETVLAGDEFRLTSREQAQNYEWTVLGSGEPARRTAFARYVFSSAGPRTIQLKLDNDPGRVYTKTIQVKPLPVVPGAPPPPPRREKGGSQLPTIENTEEVATKRDLIGPKEPEEEQPAASAHVQTANANLKDMFNGVIKGSEHAQSFNRFVCYGLKTKVLAKHRKSDDWLTILSFCNMIKNNRNYTVTGVEATWENGCIKVLTVHYKKSFIPVPQIFEK